jgi:type I restriction enzyme S subunit
MSETISIDQFLTKSEDSVLVEPEVRYKQITARLWGKGLSLRGEVRGSEIAAARQVRVRAGQFLISRIDARHGAFGIIPAELDGALVSNDFPSFDIDTTKVLPHFFEWYSRTPAFIDLCRRASEGSTNRVRLKEDEFLKMRVPHVKLEEQRRIVEVLDRVAKLVSMARSLRARADSEKSMLLEKLHFAHAAEEARPFGDFITLSEDRVGVIADHVYPQVGIKGFGGGLFFKEATEGSKTSYKNFNRLHADMLVVSQPKGWEGAVAVASVDHEGWFASPEYRTFLCKEGELLPEYLRLLVRTAWFQTELSKLTRGQDARRERLRPDMLESMLVRMPPVADQHRTLLVHKRVQEIGRCADLFDNDLEAVVPAMVHEIFSGKAAAA